MRAFLHSCYLFSLLFALFLLGKKKDWEWDNIMCFFLEVKKKWREDQLILHLFWINFGMGIFILLFDAYCVILFIRWLQILIVH